MCFIYILSCQCSKIILSIESMNDEIKIYLGESIPGCAQALHSEITPGRIKGHCPWGAVDGTHVGYVKDHPTCSTTSLARNDEFKGV